MIQKSVTQILRCVAPNVVMQRRLTTKCTPICRLMEAPSRFNAPMDFIEGWGLYVEGLGLRMGLYSDPNSLFGHYFIGNEAD